jgi:hypothetical protein
MGGAWRYRVARDDKGKLHFVFARYDVAEPGERRGMVGGIFNEGDTIEDMRRLIRELEAACDTPIINLNQYELEPPGEADDDYDE